MVACDQPFEEVERPEFLKLMKFVHHSATANLHVPSRKGIQRRVMKMGEDTIESVCEMFKVSYCNRSNTFIRSDHEPRN